MLTFSVGPAKIISSYNKKKETELECPKHHMTTMTKKLAIFEEREKKKGLVKKRETISG